MKNAYVYKETPTRDLELYADFPKDWKASDKRPAIVWFFGGAWNTGSPFAFKPQADYFARRGVVGIRVDYRIRTVDGIKNDGYISGLDAKTAIRWVRKNAASLGIDPNNIMAGGDSAGGHLAIATQIPELNDPADDLSISSKVSALLLHNPYVVYINPKSWIYQIDFKTLPPVWVAYGLKDKAAYNDDPSTKRRERNGESFVKELGQAGIPLRTYIKADGGHGFCSGAVHLNPSTLDIDDFLQACGLLPKGKVAGPGKKTAGAWASEHMREIVQGQAILSQPRTLEFVSAQ
jgi:acetyl esterase/lipase